MNACIIGVSGYGRVHYHALLSQIGQGVMRVVGATVINQEEEPERSATLQALGAELFTDHREMLDRFKGNVDLCFIPTGIHLHAPMTLDALRAGANVYVEKPVAAVYQDVLAMRQCESESGRLVAVGYQLMYADGLLEFKQRIREYVGELHTAKAYCAGARPDSYYARNKWAGRLKAGDAWVLDSPFNNAFAHRLAWLCFIVGAAPEESAEITGVQAELYRARDIESADTACLKIDTAAGPRVLYYVTHCPEAESENLLVLRGDKGALRWNADGQAFYKPVSGTEQDVALPLPTYPKYPYIMERVRQRITERKGFICGLQHAGAHTLCVNGAHESSPINTVDASLTVRAPFRDSERTIITGIDRLMGEAFEKECFFSDLGVPWAGTGARVSMKGYREFKGGV